ncbi:MAG TPA: chemotaxis protein CheW [Methylotenera sp.]|nr:chemotaxis protein CheW [Methylotenera sp.]
MSKQSQLREYQTSILARLENAKKTGTEASAGHLGVVIGSKNVLVNLREISETLPVADIHPVPIVKPWFLGVANVRGVLYAINDLAQLLEAKFTSVSSNTRLLLISDAVSPNVAFVVEKMIGLRNLNDMKPHEVESEDSACLKEQTYQDDENRIWHMLDCDKLVRSKEFATPYVV